MKKTVTTFFAVMLTLAATSLLFAKGSSDSATAGGGKKFVIGMAQCNLGEPWRVAMNAQIAAAAKNYPMFEVIFSDAAQDLSLIHI